MARKGILFVDDNAQLVDVYAHLLPTHMPEHDFDFARGGVQAWDMFLGARHDLIVADLNMPEVGGLALYERVTQYCVDEGHELPMFIFASGVKKALEEAMALVRKGGIATVQKPFSLEELKRAIQGILGQDSRAG